MHMQVKPAQRYFRHEKKKIHKYWRETKHDINSRRVLTIIVHPNFWIGTLRDSENSEFYPFILLKWHNFCGCWKDLLICCKVWKTCCLQLSVSFFPLQPFILKHSDTSPSCENLIKWNNKIQFIFTLLAFDHPPNLWLQSASKLFQFSPRLSPITDIALGDQFHSQMSIKTKQQ